MQTLSPWATKADVEAARDALKADIAARPQVIDADAEAGGGKALGVARFRAGIL